MVGALASPYPLPHRARAFANEGLNMKCLAMLFALALLAGCGQSANTALPQGAIAQARAHKTSGSYGDLIYAARGKVVYIFTYPSGEYVTQFVPPNAVTIGGLCSDASGSVFVDVNGSGSDSGVVYEYSHGATSPSATLPLGSGYTVAGCASETAYPKLAVAVLQNGTSAIAVFKDDQTQPHVESDGSVKNISSVTFEDHLNIIAWADKRLWLMTQMGHPYWLFEGMTMNEVLQRYGHFVQWGGYQLAVLTRRPRPKAKSRIQQVQVDGYHTKVTGTINFNGLGSGSGTAFALQGSSVLLSMSSGKNPSIGIYPYPEGGNPETVISGYSADFLTVSVEPSRSRIRK